MAEPLIRAHNLSLQSGNKFLLHEINWEVYPGEHWLVFGMNGSGKTTLLSIVAGFNSASSGELTLFGERFTDENIFHMRRKIGWISNSFFEKHLSYESVLNIVLSGLSGTLGIRFYVLNEDVYRAKEILKELRIIDKLDTPFCYLSKGEQQNVLLARALINQPRILVLDEPGTGFDIYAREYMLNTVEDLAKDERITVIYVTHYADEIRPFLNKTLLLKNGRVFAQGDTQEVLTTTNISNLIGDPVTVEQNAVSKKIEISLNAPSKIRKKFFSK